MTLRSRRSILAIVAASTFGAGLAAAAPASAPGSASGAASPPRAHPAGEPTERPRPPDEHRADSTPAAEADDGEPFEGRVLAYLLSPDAGVTGLLFVDGREAHVPPAFGPRLVELVGPGQSARVGARPRPTPDMPRPAWPAITAVGTGRTLAPGEGGVPDGPASPPPGERALLQPMSVSGTIDRVLRGPRGETSGLRLTNGVQIAFPPRVAVAAGSTLAPGRPINVEGYGRSSTFGTAIQATRIETPPEAPLRVYGR